MRLAIIPARGGSRRVPRKNVRRFRGQPLLVHAIGAALSSCAVDRVWVSTDDAETAAIARDAGAEVPFERPAALADDHAVLADVMDHAVRHALAAGLPLEAVCLVFATAPTIDPSDIERGLAALIEGGADQALAVTPFTFAPQRAQRLRPDGTLGYVMPEHRRTRSQDLEPLYHDAAHFVWGRPRSFLLGEARAEPRTVPVIVDPRRVVDIDTPDDWQRAELCYDLLRVA